MKVRSETDSVEGTKKELISSGTNCQVIYPAKPRETLANARNKPDGKWSKKRPKS